MSEENKDLKGHKSCHFKEEKLFPALYITSWDFECFHISEHRGMKEFIHLYQ